MNLCNLNVINLFTNTDLKVWALEISERVMTNLVAILTFKKYPHGVLFYSQIPWALKRSKVKKRDGEKIAKILAGFRIPAFWDRSHILFWRAFLNRYILLHVTKGASVSV